MLAHSRQTDKACSWHSFRFTCVFSDVVSDFQWPVTSLAWFRFSVTFVLWHSFRFSMTCDFSDMVQIFSDLCPLTQFQIYNDLWLLWCGFRFSMTCVYSDVVSDFQWPVAPLPGHGALELAGGQHPTAGVLSPPAVVPSGVQGVWHAHSLLSN